MEVMSNKNKFLITLWLFSTLAWITMTSRCVGQTISNGGFELWPPGCPVNVAPNNWTNFSSSLGPDQAGTCAGTVVSYQGSSHMNLVWYSVNSLFEGAEQTITGLSIGTVYQIGFYAINDKGLYAYTDPVVLDVYINSSVVFSTPVLYSGGVWTAYAVNFTATATSQTLGFRVNAGPSGTAGSVGVDAVAFNQQTGINTLFQDNELEIYPNPFSSQAVLQSDRLLQNVTVEMDNCLGQTVKQMKNISGRTITLERDDLPSGVYFIKLLQDNKVVGTKKLIIND
jgi:hypothetical protein